MTIETKAQEVSWLRAERDRITDATLADCRKLLRAAAADRDHPPASDAIRAHVDHGLIVRGAA